MKSNLTNHIALTITSAFLILASGPVKGQTVVNGSFETGTNFLSASIQVNAGDSTSITGWTVTSGNIDYIGSLWMAGDGNRSLDLSGTAAGTIEQIITGFTVGQSYQLSFLMAANTQSGPAIKSLQASIGSASQTFTFDGTGHSGTDMGWSLRTMNFTATSSSLALDFTGLQNGLYGAALDEVAINPVPEPGTMTLLGIALACSVGTLRRRIKK